MKNAPIARLGDVFEFQNGRGFKKSEWRESGLPIIRIQNLNDSSAPFNHYDGEYDPKIEVNSGDLLFSWSGTVGSSFGPHLWQRQKGVLNQHIFRVLFLEDLDKRYALHALQFITAEIEKQVSGAVGLVHITKGKLKEFTIPLPPLQEQKRIVAILDEAFEGIDKAIANTEKNLANAKELFESHLNAVFSEKGEGWVEKKLGDICGITSKLVDPREPNYQQMLHIGAGNMVSDTGELVDVITAKEEGLKSGKYPFDSTMVLYSKIRPYLRKVCRPDFEGLCSADVYPLTPIKEDLSRDFLFYLLLSNHFTEYAESGSARAGMPKVNRDHLFAYSTPLPSLKTQSKCVAVIDKAKLQSEQLMVVNHTKLISLKELKQSILQKAFSGELTSNPDKTLAKAGA